ncbi:hypothetical protein FZC33_26250 [Labrys sp. KNU-23]|uniref:hypothetical protein n=1 Tax=Labrys sp. KNU-23 TaxID=2789216 RepID=UPI0011EDFDBF|nr:hypothetical protein [Labrys sp. KNU-23]QEN89600.1 hypothetical protein FZC33_26250 [Labrys sp. KNU-23]
MDDRPMKKARMLAEIASIQKQAKVLAVQKNRGAHYERLAREAEERVAKLRESIATIDAELAAAKQ